MAFFFETCVVEPRRPNGLIGIALIDSGVTGRVQVKILTCSPETAAALGSALKAALEQEDEKNRSR